MTSSNDNLDNFYTILRGKPTVEDFLRQHKNIFEFIHSSGLTEDHRLGRGMLKRLRDEVTPVARFVRKYANPGDCLSFAMNDEYPDCTIWHQDGCIREVEMTIAQARERLNLMTELNETGVGEIFRHRLDGRQRRRLETR